MTHTSNTISSDTDTRHNSKIPDLFRRVRQALYFGKEDLYNYQDEFQTGLDMLHELIQDDAFVDEDARQLIIDSLEVVSKLLKDIESTP
jgi:hypothetical protein